MRVCVRVCVCVCVRVGTCVDCGMYARREVTPITSGKTKYCSVNMFPPRSVSDNCDVCMYVLVQGDGFICKDIPFRRETVLCIDKRKSVVSRGHLLRRSAAAVYIEKPRHSL